MKNYLIPYIFICIILLCPAIGRAQFPTGPSVKTELGAQTSNNKYLLYLGSGAPAYTPTSNGNAWIYVDTTNTTVYQYTTTGGWLGLTSEAELYKRFLGRSLLAGAYQPSLTTTIDQTPGNFIIAGSGGESSVKIFTLENSASGFEGYFDFSVPDTIHINYGTLSVPVENYIYIDHTDQTTKISNTGWPNVEHSKLAYLIVQDSVSVANEGVYKFHAYTDHLANSKTGHLDHINFWIRQQNATYQSGIVPTMNLVDAAPDQFWVTTTSGSVLQLHPHGFPEFTDTTTFQYLVVNDFTTPYNHINSFEEITTDADGDAIGNSYFSLVVWGVISEDSEDCKIMINLPTGTYGTESGVQNDADGFTTYSIPDMYKGTGFLIAKYNIRRQSGGNTITIVDEIDLRGTIPSSAVGAIGGGSGGPVTEFQDNQFKILDNLDGSKEAIFEASSISTATSRVFTFPDVDGTLALDNTTNTYVPYNSSGTFENSDITVASGFTTIRKSTIIGPLQFVSTPFGFGTYWNDISGSGNQGKITNYFDTSYSPNSAFIINDISGGGGGVDIFTANATNIQFDRLAQFNEDIQLDNNGILGVAGGNTLVIDKTSGGGTMGLTLGASTTVTSGLTLNSTLTAGSLGTSSSVTSLLGMAANEVKVSDQFAIFNGSGNSLNGLQALNTNELTTFGYFDGSFNRTGAWFGIRPDNDLSDPSSAGSISVEYSSAVNANASFTVLNWDGSAPTNVRLKTDDSNTRIYQQLIVDGDGDFTSLGSNPALSIYTNAAPSDHGMDAHSTGPYAGTALTLHSGPGGALAYTPNMGVSWPFYVNNDGSTYIAGTITAPGATTDNSETTLLAINGSNQIVKRDFGNSLTTDRLLTWNGSNWANSAWKQVNNTSTEVYGLTPVSSTTEDYSFIGYMNDATYAIEGPTILFSKDWFGQTVEGSMRLYYSPDINPNAQMTFTGVGSGTQLILDTDGVEVLDTLILSDVKEGNLSPSNSKILKLNSDNMVVYDTPGDQTEFKAKGENLTTSSIKSGWGLRLINPNYTGYIFRLWRVSDNTETDLYSGITGQVDTAFIKSHCGTSDCRVRRIYDQYGSYNLNQTTEGDMPKIYDGTTQALLLDPNKNLYAEFLDSRNDHMDAAFGTDTATAVVARTRWTDQTGFDALISSSNTAYVSGVILAKNPNITPSGTYGAYYGDELRIGVRDGIVIDISNNSADNDVLAWTTYGMKGLNGGRQLGTITIGEKNDPDVYFQSVIIYNDSTMTQSEIEAEASRLDFAYQSSIYKHDIEKIYSIDGIDTETTTADDDTFYFKDASDDDKLKEITSENVAKYIHSETIKSSYTAASDYDVSALLFSITGVQEGIITGNVTTASNVTVTLPTPSVNLSGYEVHTFTFKSGSGNLIFDLPSGNYWSGGTEVSTVTSTADGDRFTMMCIQSPETSNWVWAVTLN